MTTLIDTFPLLAREVSRSLRTLGRTELAREVSRSLRTLGRTELAQQVDDAIVSRVTFDESAGVGYVYVEPARGLNVVEANIIGARHGETITVETQFDAVIDADNFQRLMGIELLAPGVLTAELKRRAGA